MLLNIVAFLDMWKNNQLIAASLSVRFPVAITGSCLACHICQDEDVVDGTLEGDVKNAKVVPTKGAYSIYEQFICQGTGCAPGKGGISWLCEQCALMMDIKQMIANKKFLVDIKRNMVCQCKWGSPALVTTYAAMQHGNYKLDASAQYGAVIDGKQFFTTPSMEEIVANPNVLMQHMVGCYKKTPEGGIATTLTFNAGIANAQNGVKSCRLSVQCIWDEQEDTMSVIGSLPVSETKVTQVDKRPKSKGANRAPTRGAGPSKKPCYGTSSDFAYEEKNSKSTGNVIKFGFPFKDIDGTGEPAELVFEGVLPPGTATGLIDRLALPQTTEPSFCPIRTITEIATCVSATSPEDAENRKALFEIFDTHNMKHKVVDDKIVILDIDTGKERIFKGVSESLVLCGFGDRADKWDWHVVVLRRGRFFLTLYILVVHAPYPGLWVIAERLSVGETVAESTIKTIMVGQDVSAYSHVQSGNILMQRGNWRLEYMHWYIGFSEHSNALQTCVNRVHDKTGPLLHELVEKKFLTMDGVFAGFVRQKNIITAALAAEDVTINNTFIAKISAQHEAQQKLNGVAAPTPYFPGTSLSLGVYGDLRVVVRQYDDMDDEDGDLVSKCTVTPGVVPEMCFEIPSNVLVKVSFDHTRGLHANMVMHATDWDLVHVDENDDEECFGSVEYKVDHWQYEMPDNMCNFESHESHSSLLLRDHETQQTILKMRFNHCPQ